MKAFSRFQSYLDQVFEGVISSRGELSSAQRQAIIDYAASLTLGQPGELSFLAQEELLLVQQIVFTSNEINDQQISDLASSGVSEDRILELMYCAAVGTGKGRFEKVRELLS